MSRFLAKSIGHFCRRGVLGIWLLGWLAPGAWAANYREALELLHTGEYDQAIAMADAEIQRGLYLEQWRHVKIRAELARGKYADALASVEEALETYAGSLTVQMLAHQVCLLNNQPEAAANHLATIEWLARRNPRRYNSAEDRVLLGKYLLHQGAEARQVLELFYDPVIKQFPELPDGHFASAELALEKYDSGLAADILKNVPAEIKELPEYHYLVARAYANANGERTAEAIEAGLKINPRHVPTLLLRVENLIDREAYDEAGAVFDQIAEINPRHPQAWAYRAVLANLEGNERLEQTARNAALEPWPSNPEVDYTIGRKLSDKYRFAEGAIHQRRALVMDSSYLPARMQLAQDLLRLGQEDEGWQLVHDVFAADGYNVVAHNLVTLHDSFAKYRVLADADFHVRMEAREADIYGRRVVQLLHRAKDTLTAKYGFAIDEPIAVDIFPQQSDFAVRTFGIPGADGFLGVCFGNVITANSPAALRNTQANWESVLWHEFCHVVTLRKSQNKMPRWFSEGISVYEESQENSTWGQRMTPVYRQMILSGERAPMSELSSSFLAPKSPQHLMFAYFESSLAVEFLVERYGFAVIGQLLDDLGNGVSMNQALATRVAPLGELDAGFDIFLTARAEALARELNWDECDLPATAAPEELEVWLEAHPDNYYAMSRLTQLYLRGKEYDAALPYAERLVELYPEHVEPGNAYAMLVRIYRGLDDVTAEERVLKEWAERSGDAADAYFRLIELGAERQDWPLVIENAKRLLAVDPLGAAPHRYLAQAAIELDRPDDAIDAYRALLYFDTSNPVESHYRLATLLAEQNDKRAARREVLLALADAPRFREAHELLLELVELGAGEVAPTARVAVPHLLVPSLLPREEQP